MARRKGVRVKVRAMADIAGLVCCTEERKRKKKEDYEGSG